MKGLELPINMIVVVAIAVLVLVVVAAFFAGQLGGGTNTIAIEAAFSSGCNSLRSTYNCADLSFLVNYQEQGSTNTQVQFSRICQLKGYTAVISNAAGSCTKACGCVISTP
ncbi:MAG: hypothetical protein WC613_04605 [Candidatus Aenigmatarchaeota archaeon]